jgi:hypothetical protein
LVRDWSDVPAEQAMNASEAASSILSDNVKMTPHNFISKLNWRQILLHLIAFWFFIYAFETFSYLTDTKLIELFRHSNQYITRTTLEENGMSASNISDSLFKVDIAGLIGLVVAFIISLVISIRQHWFWVNSLIALLIFFIPVNLRFLRKIFWVPRQIFDDVTIEFLLNGIILLTIGLLILFWSRPKRFIENNKPVKA